MELEEEAEELLETLWIRTQEAKETSIPLAELAGADQKPVEQLLGAGYITLTDDQVRLTDTGRPHAQSVVRRHRLAERLLVDVLGAGDRLMDERACKFEHLLDRGLDESVCSLLGHPKVCPHGKPIPPGRCCYEERVSPRRIVSPLSQLAQGQIGKVAYIYAHGSEQLQKLMAMGVLPGAPISLIQSFPSYVFQIQQTQFAVDKEIADAIYVRLVETEVSPEEIKPARRRWWWGRQHNAAN
jgi:DtxR family Mn-dependent transcriptional regulator